MAQLLKDEHPQAPAPAPTPSAPARGALRLPTRTERHRQREETLRRLRAARAAFARMHRSP